MSDRVRLGAIFAIFAAIIAVMTLFTNAIWQGGVSYPTSYSADPKGCKGFYLLLEEMALPVERLRTPFNFLKGRGQALIVANPKWRSFSPREVRKLKKWVENGNRLIIFQDPPPKRRKKSQPKKEIRLEDAVKSGLNNDLAKGFGLRMKRLNKKSSSVLWAHSPSSKKPGSRFPISVLNLARWKNQPAEWKVLAADRFGPVAVSRKLGQGRVIAFSDPLFLSNGSLPKEQNLRMALDMVLENERPRKIIFDECHHGYLKQESLSGYVMSSVFSWFLVQALVGLALYFYSRRARQSGRFRKLNPPPGRSSMEYVESMSRMLHSCGASSAALEAILDRFISEVARRTGVNAKTVDDERLQALTVPVGQTRSQAVGPLIAECQKAARSGVDVSEAVSLARRISEVRTEIRGAIDAPGRIRVQPGTRTDRPVTGGK